MTLRRASFAAALSAVAVSTFFFSRSAEAAPTIGADLDVTFPTHSRGDSGGGFGIRLGQQLHVPLAVLTPEIGFSYHNFSGDFGPKIYRGLFGLRLGFGEVLRPGAFAHVGIGHFVPTFGDNRNAFAFDAGGFLDLTIIPLIDVGAHAAYNRVDADYSSGAYGYVTVGLHAALVF